VWLDRSDPYYVALETYENDPLSDWYLRADVSVSALVGFYRKVWAFADATIDELPLDTVGSPPWWPLAAKSPSITCSCGSSTTSPVTRVRPTFFESPSTELPG
jgi:hypothetical protein